MTASTHVHDVHNESELSRGHANVSVHASQRLLCNTLRAEEERDNQMLDMEGVALATEILQEELQCTQVLAAASHSMHCICSGRPLSIHK